MKPRHDKTGARGPLVLLAAAVALLALTTARLRGLFVNTALLAVGALVISVPLGTLLGLVVAKIDLAGRRALAWLLAGLLFVPLYVQAAGWQTVLGAGGWVAHWVRSDGYANPWLVGWRGALWVQGMAGVPWVALAAAASLSTVERKLEEESLLDAGPWRVLWRVSLPRAGGGVLAAAAWIAVVAATEIAVSDLYQVRTFAEEVYTQAALGPLLSWSAGGTIAPVVGPTGGAGTGGGIGGGPGVTPPSFATSFLSSELATGTVALVLLVLAALWWMAHWLPPAAAIVADAGWKWRPAPRRRACLGLCVWLVVAIVVLVPMAGLAWKAGGEVHHVGERYQRSWSAAKAALMVVRSPWENCREWGWSLAIGGIASAGATAIGLACGWAARMRSSAAVPLAAAIAAGLAVPAPLVGAWVIALLNQPPDSSVAWFAVLYDRTLTAPVLVQIVRAAPLAALWMWSQLASVPQDLLEASRSEGASRFAQLVRVALPLRRLGLAAGAAAALIVAYGRSLGDAVGPAAGSDDRARAGLPVVALRGGRSGLGAVPVDFCPAGRGHVPSRRGHANRPREAACARGGRRVKLQSRGTRLRRDSNRRFPGEAVPRHGTEMKALPPHQAASRHGADAWRQGVWLMLALMAITCLTGCGGCSQQGAKAKAKAAKPSPKPPRLPKNSKRSWPRGKRKSRSPTLSSPAPPRY